MKYRLGRSHQDIVYRQLGDEPSDEDPRVAVFSDAIEAIRVVRLLNGDAPQPVDEPVVEPPPVDALLETAPLAITRLGYDRFAEAFSRGDHKQAIACAVDAVWASGVAEGRRQLEHAEKVAAVHAYELGIAEGRRQATEERTEGGRA